VTPGPAGRAGRPLWGPGVRFRYAHRRRGPGAAGFRGARSGCGARPLGARDPLCRAAHGPRRRGAHPDPPRGPRAGRGTPPGDRGLSSDRGPAARRLRLPADHLDTPTGHPAAAVHGRCRGGLRHRQRGAHPGRCHAGPADPGRLRRTGARRPGVGVPARRGPGPGRHPAGPPGVGVRGTGHGPVARLRARSRRAGHGRGGRGAVAPAGHLRGRPRRLRPRAGRHRLRRPHRGRRGAHPLDDPESGHPESGRRTRPLRRPGRAGRGVPGGRHARRTARPPGGRRAGTDQGPRVTEGSSAQSVAARILRGELRLG